jgi:inosine/xanthosine triphosphatase
MEKVHVGSLNQTKIQAVKNLSSSYGFLKHAEILAINVPVEEFDHPKSIDETIAGAKYRANAAFTGCDLSVGIESGLIEASETETGFLETTACALYDGNRYAIGLSPSFEWPKSVLDRILAGMDGSQAFKDAGFTAHEKLGTAEGAIHTLTNRLMDRTKLNELAVTMALIQYQNPKDY